MAQQGPSTQPRPPWLGRGKSEYVFTFRLSLGTNHPEEACFGGEDPSGTPYFPLPSGSIGKRLLGVHPSQARRQGHGTRSSRQRTGGRLSQGQQRVVGIAQGGDIDLGSSLSCLGSCPQVWGRTGHEICGALCRRRMWESPVGSVEAVWFF